MVFTRETILVGVQSIGTGLVETPQCFSGTFKRESETDLPDRSTQCRSLPVHDRMFTLLLCTLLCQCYAHDAISRDEQERIRFTLVLTLERKGRFLIAGSLLPLTCARCPEKRRALLLVGAVDVHVQFDQLLQDRQAFDGIDDRVVVGAVHAGELRGVMNRKGAVHIGRVHRCLILNEHVEQLQVPAD